MNPPLVGSNGLRKRSWTLSQTDLHGLPSEWLKAGAVTKLNGLATPFGRLYMMVQVDKSARIIHQTRCEFSTSG